MSAPLRTTLASVWAWSLLGIGALVILPIVWIWRLVGRGIDPWNYHGGRLFRHLGILFQRGTARWRFEVRGPRPANPRNPYVVVANHESFADIILLTHLPWEMKWLSKAEMFRIPVFGWIMSAVRDIPVHRGKATSAKAAMDECRKRLAGKVSVMIFPEGTRSKTAEMLPFKDGAFRLAIEEGVPILPIALYGTRDAIAKHDWRIGPAHAIVEILEPISTDGLTLEDVAQLRDTVRERIGTARDTLRAELRTT
jgi:1-acyl-sn-glycerol-3-phosphate acyltransferase